MTNWHRLSLICGFTPLILGAVIFVSWILTDANWLRLAGVYNIYFGLLCFAAGIFSLGMYYFIARKRNNNGYLMKAALSLSVLIINFPVAAAAILSASYIMSTNTVIVRNNTPYEITDFILSEREKVYKLPKIGSKQVIEEGFHFYYEGAVNYHFTLNGQAREGIMFGYVTSGLGGNAVMVISEDGKVDFEKKSNQANPADAKKRRG